MIPKCNQYHFLILKSSEAAMKFQQLITRRIKHLLKQKGISYRNLALKLKVSESTVKRWFSLENLKLENIDKITQACDLDTADLLKTLKPESIDEFTHEQELELDANEKLLALFYLLSSSMSLQQIEQNYTFTPKELDKYTLVLDRIGLIELGLKNQIKLNKSLSTKWRTKGLLSKKYFSRIREEFTNSYFNGPGEGQYFISGSISPEIKTVISKKIERLALEINELVDLEREQNDYDNYSILLGHRSWKFSVVSQYLRSPADKDKS